MEIAVHPKGGKGKRNCPALNGWISARDCGQHRLKKIKCVPDCKYLAQHERYQHAKTAEDFHQAWVQAVTPHYQSQDLAAIDFLVSTEMAIYQYLLAHPTLEDEELVNGLNVLQRQLSTVDVVESHIAGLGGHLKGHFETYKSKQSTIDAEKLRSVVSLLIALIEQFQDKHDARQSVFGLIGHLETNFDLSSVEPLELPDSDQSSSVIITPASSQA